MDDEVSVGDGQRPLESIGRERIEPRHPICGFTELHHQRVACLLQEVISEIRILATLDNLSGPIEPDIDVQQLFGHLANHSQQHRVTPDIIVDLRFQTAVRNEVDFPAEDLLDQLFEPDERE